MEETIKQQWVKLLTVRSGIANRLPGEQDEKIRKSLFEAHQLVGQALLHLERVEFLTDASSREAIDNQGEAQPK